MLKRLSSRGRYVPDDTPVPVLAPGDLCFACSKMKAGGESWTGGPWIQPSSLQQHTFLPSARCTCFFVAAKSTATSTSRRNSIATSWPPIPKAGTSPATSATASGTATFLAADRIIADARIRLQPAGLLSVKTVHAECLRNFRPSLPLKPT